MAFETTGGGRVISDDRSVVRRVMVQTGGGDPEPPGGPGTLTNVSITREAGGISRGVFEYTLAGIGGGQGATYDGRNSKRIELTGGSREVPVQTHAAFAELSEQEIAEVETRINNPQADLWFTTNTNGDSFTEKQQLLYNLLRRKVEYVLAPSIVGRVSEIESSLPSLEPIAKVANPSELDAPNGTFWICTAITATPIGSEFEVTREYTLNFSEWDNVNLLYGWGNNA